MDTDDSIILTYMKDEYNRRVDAGDSLPDPEEFVDEVFYDSEKLWPDRFRWTKRNTLNRLHFRARDARKIKRHLVKRYARAFRAFDATLAAAEFVNRSLTDAAAGNTISSKFAGLLGMKNTIGGLGLKHLLLIGMHARMVSIGTEISSLLQTGFPEAAAARARTLYELVVKALLIVSDESPGKVQLAERYYVTATLEWQGQGGDALGELTQELLVRARNQWGNSFFEGDNNWALPVMGDAFKKKRVTFRDLEDALDMDDLRHMYIECNQAVHAGALRIVGNADFRRRYLYATEGVIDLKSTGRIGQASVYYLEMGTYFLARGVSSELKEWDFMLDVADFLKNVRLANKLFYEGYGQLAN